MFVVRIVLVLYFILRRQRAGLISIAPLIPGKGDSPPDLRVSHLCHHHPTHDRHHRHQVIMCLHCGDPFSIEKVLGPLLGHSSCVQSGSTLGLSQSSSSSCSSSLSCSKSSSTYMFIITFSLYCKSWDGVSFFRATE